MGRRRGSTRTRAATGRRPRSCARLAVAPGGVPFFRATRYATAIGEVGSLAISASMTDTGWRRSKPTRAICMPTRPSATAPTITTAGAGQLRRRDQRQGQHERREHRVEVEEDAAVEVRDPEARLQREVQSDVEDRTGADDGGEGDAVRRWIDLAGDAEAAERVDHGAQETQEVRRAPERDVEAEQTVPEVVDRRRED